MKQRIFTFDALKCFAIYLVIYGHCIQHLRDNGDVKDDLVFQLIYSFHMPLFMMVSGYFSYSSYNIPFVPFLAKKSKQLILPWLTGVAIMALLMVLNTTSVNDMGGGKIKHLFWNFWFLRSLFLCYIYSYISAKLFQIDSFRFCVLGLFLSALLGVGSTSYLYFFFLLGLRARDRLSRKQDNQVKFSILFLLVWFSLFVLLYMLGYKKPLSLNLLNIYLGKYSSNSSEFLILPVWLVMASCGCLGIYKIMQSAEGLENLKNRRLAKLKGIVSKIGQKTLQIYILQVFLLETLIAKYLSFDTVNTIFFDCVVAPIMSFFILFICYWSCIILEKNVFISKYLFGKAIQNV